MVDKEKILEFYKKDMEVVKKEDEIIRLQRLMKSIIDILEKVEKIKCQDWENEVEPIAMDISSLHFDILHHTYIPLRLIKDPEETLKNFE